MLDSSRLVLKDLNAIPPQDSRPFYLWISRSRALRDLEIACQSFTDVLPCHIYPADLQPAPDNGPTAPEKKQKSVETPQPLRLRLESRVRGSAPRLEFNWLAKRQSCSPDSIKSWYWFLVGPRRCDATQEVLLEINLGSAGQAAIWPHGALTR